eukprot:CAMPEP_0197024200 /NCGR_PEP_ID=MMETSP1384-20130603/4811_1 /TAXON_ID=29189 /ORGANISM="Ammonia sp." /LENGTH=912 /DNA_ID=CAMNT_0042452547 /DNA_START=130 /DNA_END=2868 /DNA_ORIENTATION=+
MNKTRSLFLLSVCAITSLVDGGIPISWPFCDTATYPNCALYTGPTSSGKVADNLPYNLIDVDPICWYRGWCPCFPPGGEYSAFPNSEEKFQQILHNLHRMFANQTLGTSYGKYPNGANTNGGPTTYCTTSGCDFCGDWDDDYRDPIKRRRPQYWYSDANQAARFKQFDYTTCNKSWFYQTGVGFHTTCKWGDALAADSRVAQWGKHGTSVMPEDRCALFMSGSCTPDQRLGTFAHEDNAWFETEGICGGNTCVTDPHCDPIFGKAYDYVGKGFVEGMNGVGAEYARFTNEVFYPLIVGVHFDERMKIVDADYEPNGNYLTFLLEYFDSNFTQNPDQCWVLYDGQAYEMEVYLSNSATSAAATEEFLEGSYLKNDNCVMYRARFQPPSTCKPYAFICTTDLGNVFRLPEESHYFFGTEWIDWKWSNYSTDYGLSCKENHYYCPARDQDPAARCTASEWLVNGGPVVAKEEDIWYYRDSRYGTCLGCNAIESLECWSDCMIFNHGTSTCSSQCVTTSAPTLDTAAPTLTPSDAPTSTTVGPTPAPTGQPTSAPTKTPTGSPIGPPTTSPTKTPTDTPTAVTGAPTSAPTTPEPTSAGETCVSVAKYSQKFTRIEFNPGEPYTAYLESIEQSFIDQNTPGCGAWAVGNLEYTYMVIWDGNYGQIRKRNLQFYLEVCCGEGATFGPSFTPRNVSYRLSQGWRAKYNTTSSYTDETSWTDPSKFGAKQYIVFTLIGLIVLGCIAGGIYGGIWYKKHKQEENVQRPTNFGLHPSQLANKSRSSNRALPAIPMTHVPAGPSHVALPGRDRDSTQGSTDGDNRYTGQFIHTREATDGSEHQDRGVATMLAPPLTMLGKHGMVQSVSIDSEQRAEIEHQLEAPALFSGGLPPVVAQTSADDEVHDMDDEEIHDAFGNDHMR